MNRGGLLFISDSMYQFLVSVELEIRKHFTVPNATIEDSLKSRAIQGVLENEDIPFHWACFSVNWDATESEELLRRISELYITIRGFSFASGVMEQYKRALKKSTQKTKALRKTLDTTKDVQNN